MPSNKLQSLLFVLVIGMVPTTNTKPVKIAFFMNVLSLRGVDVATYDYADCNETILGNESIIISNTEYMDSPGFLLDYTASVREKFIKRFGSRFFDCNTMQDVEDILRKEKVDLFYVQKFGCIDSTISKVCKNIVHAVFTLQVHGDAYASISSWLSNTRPALRVPFIPYMVRLDDTKETLHEELHIPQGAVVFGRHGGFQTFDLSFAKEAVQELAQQHKDWYFLFLNTNKFCNLPNVIFLPGTANMVYKTKFINTCDAMLHARSEGETFGLACAEFSIQNKPIITWLNSSDRSHIEILGTKGFYYTNKHELLKILQSIGTNINEIRTQHWDTYSKDYNPQAVMKKFHEVFIQPFIN